MKMKQIIYFVLLLLYLASCGKSQLPGEQTDAADTTAVLHIVDKTQVKAFWDAYRQAQKMRTAQNWVEAISWYKKAIAIDSLHEDSWFNMGNMLLELQQYKEAEKCWLKVVVFNDNSTKAHMQLGRLYMAYDRPEVFDIEKARQQFLKSASINIVITGPQMQLGHLNLIAGKTDEAKAYYQRVIGSDTRNIEAHFLLAYLEWKSGNTEKATQLFGKAITDSTPEKSIKNIPSEGDTKDGVVLQRPINLSFFIHYFNDLFAVDKDNAETEMLKRFNKVEARLAMIRHQIPS